MSFFFGTDLWDEMSRMQRQLEDLTYAMDYNCPKIEGPKKCQNQKAVSPFSKALCGSFCPVTDLAENDKSYVVSMDLPGVKKDELNVSVHNGVLTVSGSRRHKFETDDNEEEEKKPEEKKPEEKKEDEKKPEEKKPEEKKPEEKPATPEEKKPEEKKPEEKKPKHKVIRMESYYGSFERSISVPAGTTPEDVTAKFEDGVLTITIAKHAKDSSKKIEIQ